MTNTSTVTAAVIVAVLAAAPVYAADDATKKATKWALNGVLPPFEFDHPFDGNLQIFRVEAERIPYVCPRTADPITLGCMKHFQPDPGAPRGSCHVILAPDEVIEAAGWTPEIVLRHEIGHCNGWKTHDGARPLSIPEIEKLLRGEKLDTDFPVPAALRERPTSEVMKDITGQPADLVPRERPKVVAVQSGDQPEKNTNAAPLRLSRRTMSRIPSTKRQ